MKHGSNYNYLRRFVILNKLFWAWVKAGHTAFSRSAQIHDIAHTSPLRRYICSALAEGAKTLDIVTIFTSQVETQIPKLFKSAEAQLKTLFQ